MNAELDELEQGLEAAERASEAGRPAAVVTFHSLEDRIVKRFFRERSGGTPAGSRHRPACTDPREPTFERVARPVSPTERELAANPRARSARPQERGSHRRPSLGRNFAMSGGRSFRSLFMVASCAGAALGCYLVSLRVASERAALEGVETKIVLAQRDIRLLQTEIGTRGRLAQLERWNVRVLALSAPSADQFLNGSFELARLTQPQRKIDFQAPVVLAAAPRPEQSPINEPATDEPAHSTPAVTRNTLFHEASLKTETREVPARAVDAMPPPTATRSTDRPATAAKPAHNAIRGSAGPRGRPGCGQEEAGMQPTHGKESRG